MVRVVSCILLFLCFSAFADSARLSLSDYFTETWSTRAGLPHNSINSVTQTKDGYIWIATWEGLSRFNGREFKLFTRTEIPGLPDSGLRSLIPMDNGDLYIVGARGGIALRSQGGWRALPSSSAMVNHALVTEQGYSVAEAAQALGVNPNLLYKWKDKLEAQTSGAALSDDEREELKKLRAENKRLRMEKDILKKASAFFAREMH